MPIRLLSAIAAALCIGLQTGHVAAQQADSFPAIYRVPASQLAIPPLASVEILGYPGVTVDKRVVVQMLRQRDFSGLDRYFTGLQDAVRKRIQLEYDLVDATGAFATADSTLQPLLDEWVAAAPASAHARTARAHWYLARAWQASDASPSRSGEVADYAHPATEELTGALRIDGAQFMATSGLLEVMMLQGDRTQARALFDAARKFYPGSHYLPHRYLFLLQPRWGGSYEAMATFAAEVAADSLLNPRLRTFLGAVEADRSDMAIEAVNFDEAVRHASAALQYGPEFYYLVQRGHARVQFTDNGRGITDLNAALSQRPQYSEALEFHAVAALSSADYSIEVERQIALRQAIHDFQLILSFDPVDRDALKGLKDASFELTTCPDAHRECGGSEAGAVKVFAAVWQDIAKYLASLGVLAFVGYWGFAKWVHGGLWLPGYIHVLALLALVTVCFVDYQWVQTGSPMTLRRWIVIPVFPGLVYFLFIGLGGASWGRRS
ncbi:MAG: DUF4034 domain-containing protein [Gemmatimonadales bacterium]